MDIFSIKEIYFFDSSLRMSITIRVTFATIYGIFYIPQLIVTVLFCIKKGSLILMIRTPHIYITLLGCDITYIEAENQGCVIFVENRQSGDGVYTRYHISRVSCQKGSICHAYAWRVGPFWQETLDISYFTWIHNPISLHGLNFRLNTQSRYISNQILLYHLLSHKYWCFFLS